MAGIETVTVDLPVRRDGWVFQCYNDTPCITPSGRSGGDVTVVHALAYTIAESRVKENGEAIAALLNEGHHTLEQQR